MWPFKKKVKEEPKEAPEEDKEIILYADDTGLKRAQNAMHMAGFVINNTLYNQLPWIAQAFDEYKKLDRLVFEREEREKKAKKKKGGK